MKEQCFSLKCFRKKRLNKAMSPKKHVKMRWHVDKACKWEQNIGQEVQCSWRIPSELSASCRSLAGLNRSWRHSNKKWHSALHTVLSNSLSFCSNIEQKIIFSQFIDLYFKQGDKKRSRISLKLSWHIHSRVLTMTVWSITVLLLTTTLAVSESENSSSHSNLFQTSLYSYCLWYVYTCGRILPSCGYLYGPNLIFIKDNLISLLPVHTGTADISSKDWVNTHLLSRMMIIIVAMAIHRMTATIEPAMIPIGVFTEIWKDQVDISVKTAKPSIS